MRLAFKSTLMRKLTRREHVRILLSGMIVALDAFIFIMNHKKIRILSWNCRGLGHVDKCNVVRDVIRSARCDVCLLQETKLNEVVYKYVSRFLPSFFDMNVAYNQAFNTSGGLIIAWKRSLELVASWSTVHTLSVVLRQASTGFKFLVTNVYGPSIDEEKSRFIDELGTLASLIHHPWILAGDFNLVRWLIDRTGDLRGIQLMDLFNDFIRDVGLVDVQLKNRQYTWSNKRPTPTFSKLDRVFTSADWQLNYPVVQLEAMEMVVSDHAPLILTCKSMATRPRQHKFEIFWLKYETPRALVQQLWSTEEAEPQISLQNFSNKIITLHKSLSYWHRKDFSIMETQLINCKKATLFFDRIEEKRVLDMHEFKLRCRIKEKSFELANNIEERWRQRARCRWLTQGDRNTRYFHAFASSRMRRNAVLAINHNEQLHSNQRIIRELFLQQMQCTLSQSVQVKPFNAQALYTQNPNLGHLVTMVTEMEIEMAIKALANNKASGPNGIPNEFIKGYWPNLKGEICNIIQGFFSGRVDLSQVNFANVIMIPKVESPLSVGDF